jgi:hypothetical protein
MDDSSSECRIGNEVAKQVDVELTKMYQSIDMATNHPPFVHIWYVMTQLHMHRSYGTKAMIVTRSGTRSGARKWA